MAEWIQAAADRLGSSSKIVSLPGGLAKFALAALEYVHLAPLRRDQYAVADLDYYLDASHAREDLGWEPRLGGVEAALATLDWFLEERAVPSKSEVTA
jgi:nucleoside-diphosphate-sugar epimerase